MTDRSATQFYDEGLRQANQKNWREALQYLNNAIAKNPNHIQAHNALGMVYMRTGNNAAARKHWLKALGLDPDNATAKQCLAALNTRPPSIPIRRLLWPVAFVIALAAFLTSNFIWFGHTNHLQKELKLARSAINSVQYAEALDLHGVDQGTRQAQPQAVQQVRSVKPEIDLSLPDTSSQITAAYNQALTDCTSGKPESAMKIFQSIVDHPSPHDLKDNAQYWLAECYYSRGEYNQALIEFQKVRERYPKANKVFDSELKVAYTYCKLGRIEQARQKLLQISRDFPGDAYKSSIETLSDKIHSLETQQVMGKVMQAHRN